jgi:transcriptional regulatory protein GAL4
LLDHERSGDIPVLPSIKNAPQTHTPRTASPAGASINSPSSSHQQQSTTSQPQVTSQGNTDLDDSASTWSFPTTEPDPLASLYPDGDEEFEWDEREHNGLTGGVAMAGDDEDGVRKVMDGMATLTVDAANYGYLGMASGASHLRSLWMESGNSPSWDSGVWNDRGQDLQHLLRRQTESSSMASAVKSQTIVTRVMVDTFVDAFFLRYHPVFPILHEPTFRAQYVSRMARPGQGIWLVLVNIVAALGAFVTNPSSSDETSLSIFRTAKRYLAVNALETGNLTLVQAFAMSAMFLQKINKPNTGYNYGGVAIRMAIGLGLHKEFGSQLMSPFKQELRRRVWWSLCVLDVGATITYSRPLIWPQVGVDVALPSNIREEDLTVNSPVTPAEVDEATANTYLRVQSSYHLQTMPIYNRLISNPPPLPEELLTLDSTIVEAWLSQVPHYFHDSSGPHLDDRFALPHGINCWRYRNLRIVIFRPLLVKWALQDGPEDTLTWHEQEATNRCLCAARESIASIQNFWKSRSQTRLTAFYVLYFLFQAALIPIHCLRSKSQSGLAPEWRNQVTATLEVIESMIGLNQSASKCRDVIMSLCGSHLRSLDDEFVDYEQAFNFEPTMDATAWMAGAAPTLINENLWAGSLDNNTAELSFSNWEGDWNI